MKSYSELSDHARVQLQKQDGCFSEVLDYYTQLRDYPSQKNAVVIIKFVGGSKYLLLLNSSKFHTAN